ncbi:two component, sigma54 specific, transcriptional regulator, Fis family [Leptothrix cholodnii SP-6]|uniref:Two component, sigma54 specific, transcriptional regulator, Fis family n=1 Tax=Leptothrix cholodnii (strain ATCC 51168 / LMG 8142 / SP-6) TaxID=395495 RepID=B1XX09_LEPCP|nr:sigma-54 dependent transcriptional regulator [Leptothrix cholodnii]ACB32655.1 two component, sigma54 specific, transcriptional regulator, Fis family [Leptothrix cholodnii SP-6]
MSPSPLHSLLVVDDEPDLRTLYELTLLREGYEVETAATVEEAWAQLKDRTYSVLITDMRLPDGNGLELLRRLEQSGRSERTIVITAYGSAENAVLALKAGAYDYLTKPVDLKLFRSVIASALGRTPNVRGTAASADVPADFGHGSRLLARRSSDNGSAALRRMAGQSQAMQQVRELVEKVARSMAPVLVQGESGTGKELVARSIHQVSARAAQPFIAVNCGAIPEQLLEAEFFGYRKGAFTGAAEDREGFFQAARGGTLFLDEIGDLPISMQSKLLRAIQERAVRPVGAVSEVPLDVRIISATHRDLATEVAAGRFRQDLYYRLNVIQIRVPPLRERSDDLPELCTRVLERIAADTGLTQIPRLTVQALEHLARYDFPGNVRELENLLHRALALSGAAQICVDDLELPRGQARAGEGGWGVAPPASTALQATQPPGAAVADTGAPPASLADLAIPTDLVGYLDEVERAVLVRALERHRYNRTAAGSSMGLTLRQMRYRMARLGIHVAGEGLMVDDVDGTGLE